MKITTIVKDFFCDYRTEISFIISTVLFFYGISCAENNVLKALITLVIALTILYFGQGEEEN